MADQTPRGIETELDLEATMRDGTILAPRGAVGPGADIKPGLERGGERLARRAVETRCFADTHDKRPSCKGCVVAERSRGRVLVDMTRKRRWGWLATWTGSTAFVQAVAGFFAPGWLAGCEV